MLAVCLSICHVTSGTEATEAAAATAALSIRRRKKAKRTMTEPPLLGGFVSSHNGLIQYAALPRVRVTSERPWNILQLLAGLSVFALSLLAPLTEEEAWRLLQRVIERRSAWCHVGRVHA